MTKLKQKPNKLADAKQTDAEAAEANWRPKRRTKRNNELAGHKAKADAETSEELDKAKLEAEPNRISCRRKQADAKLQKRCGKRK
jgi:hypothetical protein